MPNEQRRIRAPRVQTPWESLNRNQEAIETDIYDWLRRLSGDLEVLTAAHEALQEEFDNLITNPQHGYLNVSGVLVPILRAEIDHAVTGSLQIVAATTGSIRMLVSKLNPSLNTEIYWASSGTQITPNEVLAPRVTYYENALPESFIVETDVGDPLMLVQDVTSSPAQISGYVFYVVMEP